MNTLHLGIIIGIMVTIALGLSIIFVDVKAVPFINETQFQLKVNQTFLLESDGVRVKFLNVTTDSRCPSDVTCIWQGEAKVLVNIIKNNKNYGDFILASISGQQDLAVQVFDEYSIHVVKVAPYPSSGKKISLSDYLVTFAISQSGILSPLHQFKLGIDPKDVKCNLGFQLIIKAKNGSPACVTPQTAQKLVQSGWSKSILETSVGSVRNSTKIITLDQNNQEITLQKGQRLLLNLGQNYDWSLNIYNNTVISRVPNVMVMQGAQGLFEVHDEGKMTLAATGDPICLKAIPRCGMPSIIFKVNIIVP